MTKHLLPAVANTVVVATTLQVGSTILSESILSFLGAGVPPPTPSWGADISNGREYLGSAWWVAFFPGMAIFLTVLSFNFIGDWLRDRWDPRLRQIYPAALPCCMLIFLRGAIAPHSAEQVFSPPSLSRVQGRL